MNMFTKHMKQIDKPRETQQKINDKEQGLQNNFQLYCCKCLNLFLKEQQQVNLVQDEKMHNNEQKQLRIPYYLPCFDSYNRFNICKQCLHQSQEFECVFCLKIHKTEQFRQNKQLIYWFKLSTEFKLFPQSTNLSSSASGFIIYAIYQKLFETNQSLIRQNNQLRSASKPFFNIQSYKSKNIYQTKYIRIICLILFIFMSFILIFNKKNQINHGINQISSIFQPILSSQQKFVFQPVGNLQYFNIQNHFEQGFINIQKKQFDYNFASIFSNKSLQLNSQYVQLQVQKIQKGWLYFGLIQQSKMNLSNKLHQHSGFYGYSGYSGTIYEDGQKTQIKCNKVKSKDKITLKVNKIKDNKIKISYLINLEICGESFIDLSFNEFTKLQNNQLSLQTLSKNMPQIKYYIVVQMYNKGDIIRFTYK